jgi:hypothetical protein
LAGRYRLDKHLVDSTTGRALWRATDLLLARGVAVEVQATVGADSEQLLSTAMAISRVRHPGIVAIYDAVEESDRAYVVREWAAGRPLRGLIANGPLETQQAVTLARSAAEGLAALHAAGAAHGNLTPTTVIVNTNFECTLTDLTMAEAGDPAADVRAVGALLYAALTARWPSTNGSTPEGVTPATLMDGRLCTPRQQRAGVPARLDSLAMQLLDPEHPAPAAAELATELNQVEYAQESRQLEGLTGQLAPLTEPLNRLRDSRIRRLPLWAKLSIPIGVLFVIIAILGVLVARVQSPPPGGFPSAGGSQTGAAARALARVKIAETSLVDPKGDGTESRKIANATDNDPSTVWRTDTYKNTPNFGGLKKGMGVKLTLAQASALRQVEVDFSQPGASVSLYATNDESALDSPDSLQPIKSMSNVADKTVLFSLSGTAKYRYVLVWITNLPPYETGYGVGISEIVPKA